MFYHEDYDAFDDSWLELDENEDDDCYDSWMEDVDDYDWENDDRLW